MGCLKMVMDAVLGRKAFRTEITWKRGSPHSDTKQGRRQHGRIHGILLFYTKGGEWTWQPQYTPYEREYIEKNYRHAEDFSGRRYQKNNLTAARHGGDTEYEWRVFRPVGGSWQAVLEEEWKSNPHQGWECRGVFPYTGRYWAYSKDRMREFSQQGRLVSAESGMPRYKRYLDEMQGVPIQDLWTDIPFALGKQRTGYPTQKPLAVLQRVIWTSSSEGDVVVPFGGGTLAKPEERNVIFDERSLDS